jgi:hypothetical protein
MKVCPLVDGPHNNIDERWFCKAQNLKIDEMATGEEFHPVDDGSNATY